MTFIRPILITALLVGFSAPLFAQTEAPNEPTIISSEAPTLRFENLNLEDGMAQKDAQNVIQDSLGYMWIATQGGLHRYNGYEFEIYTYTAFDTTSLSSSSTFGLAEASNGDLWVTAGGRLNRFNRKNKTFTQYTHDPSDSTTVLPNDLRFVYEATNGDLWLESPGSGISRIPADSTDYVIRYQHNPNDPNTISSNYVLRFTEDAAGNIWTGSGLGVNRINPNTNEITRYLEPPRDRSYRVVSQYHPPQSPDIVWLLTSNGFVKLNSRSGDYTHYLPEETNTTAQTPLRFLDMALDPENPYVFWAVGLNTGLVRFDIQTEKFTFYRNDPADPLSIASDAASNITADRSGKIWIGHFANGVSQFAPSSANFFHIRHDPRDRESLGLGGVWALHEDQNQTLWASTRQSGNYYLNRINLKSGRVTRLEHDPDNSQSILGLDIFAITEDSSGRLWVGTRQGLNLFDRQTEKATRFRKLPPVENFRGNFVYSILQKKDSANELWVGTLGGLKLFDFENGVFTDVHIKNEDIDNPTIRDLFYDSEDKLWAASAEGLIHVDPQDGDHTIYRYNSEDSTSLSSNSVRVITQRDNQHGILWVGTSGGGLNRFDVERGEATHFTTDEGLANDVIYGILEDERGTLWMSTNLGISNFNPDDNSFSNYGLEDGLIQLEHNAFAYAKGANGVLYFGHTDGITAFNPENLRSNNIPPQVIISDFRLFNKTVLPGPDAPFDEQIEKETEITIGYDQSELAFEYAGLHYSNPAKNRYKYQLIGFDEQWVDAGSRRIATYTNLAHGEYTFRVQASNADGVWNEKGTSLTLNVLPPWYRTWWAYGGFALLLAGFIFSANQFQRRRLAIKAQERAALREAELRAEEENKRRSDTEQLSKIGRAITSTLSVNEIIHTTYQNVNELMDAEVFGLGILNREKNRLEFPATTENGNTLKPYSHNLDDDSRLSARCFKNQDKIVIGDFEIECSNYTGRMSGPVRGENPESIIYMPLMQKGEVIGVLTTQSFSKHAYSEYQVTLLQNLANYAAIALDNASAYRRLNKTLEDLKAAQDQLVQQEKLASLGQLTAGIAHEIKNPLNFVNNFSDVSLELVEEIREEIRQMTGDGRPESEKGKVKSESPSPAGEGRGEGEQGSDPDLILEILDDIEANLKTIHKHGSRADSIVKSMLQHSRGGDGKMEPTPLNPLVKEYVNLAFHGMRAGEDPIDVDIQYDLDKSAGEVPLVAEDFSRVVLNIVNNAFDAMRSKLTEDGGPGTGESSIRQSPESTEAERRRGVFSVNDYKPVLVVRTNQSANTVTIEIEDNGPGIPDGMKDKILQPFFTTKKGTEGTGLGLSITNDIIKAHGGTLDIESVPGEMSRFKIKISTN